MFHEVRIHQTEPCKVAQGKKLDENWTTEGCSCDRSGAHTFRMQVQNLIAGFFQIGYFVCQFLRGVIPDASTAWKQPRKRQLSYSLKGLNNLPDIVINPQSPILPPDK